MTESAAISDADQKTEALTRLMDAVDGLQAIMRDMSIEERSRFIAESGRSNHLQGAIVERIWSDLRRKRTGNA